MKSVVLLLTLSSLLMSQNRPTPRIPAAGIEVPAADRAELEASLKRLQGATAKLAKNPLLPDVLIYQEAVRYALQYNEFLKADEIGKARKLLDEGIVRANQLAEGQAPWTTATGLVV